MNYVIDVVLVVLPYGIIAKLIIENWRGSEAK